MAGPSGLFFHSRGSSGGGGGGGGANWQGVGGSAPIESFENDEKVWLFQVGLAQKLILWIKVPQGYTPGNQIFGRFGFYTPATANVFRFQTVATLIRNGTDAVTSTTNQRTNTPGDTTNSVANQFRELNFELSSSSGQINSVGISANDLIKVELSRITPSGTDDSNDIRFIPSSTEVTFS